MTPLVIQSRYPGGNITVERVEGTDLYLHPDLRDTKPGINWFYWNFAVQDAQNRKLTFHFNHGVSVSSRGPAISYDGGQSWSWLGGDCVRTNESGFDFDYQFPPDAREVRFAVAPAYTQWHWDRFLAEHKNPALKLEKLCTSRKGRVVECARLGHLGDAPAVRVLLTARHHACESLASYSLEGSLAAALSDDSDGRWLRAHVQIVAVPFMDKDGVEDGDQGKCRMPHDHWEDYGDTAIYPEVAALKSMIAKWPAGSVKLALDLHCPSLRSVRDEPGDAEWIFFAGSAVPAISAEAQRFQRVLQLEGKGRLRYDGRHDLPYGARWNNGEEIEPTCLTWQSRSPAVKAATVLELPYATAAGLAVTAESARAFGSDLAHALRRYLEDCGMQKTPPAPSTL